VSREQPAVVLHSLAQQKQSSATAFSLLPVCMLIFAINNIFINILISVSMFTVFIFVFYANVFAEGR